LNEDRTLLYRLNAVYEGKEGFRDFDQDVERVFVAPVFGTSATTRISLLSLII